MRRNKLKNLMLPKTCKAENANLVNTIKAKLLQHAMLKNIEL